MDGSRMDLRGTVSLWGVFVPSISVMQLLIYTGHSIEDICMQMQSPTECTWFRSINHSRCTKHSSKIESMCTTMVNWSKTDSPERRPMRSLLSLVIGKIQIVHVSIGYELNIPFMWWNSSARMICQSAEPLPTLCASTRCGDKVTTRAACL